MIDLVSEPAELRFTVEITRKATGEVEVYEMVGHSINEEVEDNGSNTFNDSAE